MNPRSVGPMSASKYVGDPATLCASASPSLCNRAETLCNTLAAVDELLDAVSRKVGTLAVSKAEPCSPPRDETLANAVDGANFRAASILDKLRDLASAVGA